MMLKFTVIFLLLSLHHKVMSQAVKSPVASLVGNAFTARALDNYSLFYNPAAIGPSKLIEVRTINPNGELYNFLDDADKFKGFPSTPAAVAERITNIPLSIGLQAVPGIKFGPIAFNAFMANQTNLILRNTVYPQLDVNYNFDKGFIIGIAGSWGRGGKYKKSTKKKKNITRGGSFSLGGAVKYIDRQSLDGNFSLYGTKLYSAIIDGGSDIDSLKDSLGYRRGKGFGYNLGALYLYSAGRFELGFGAAILDAFNTKFKAEETGQELSEIPMRVNTGVSFKQSFPGLHYVLSMDAGPLLQDIAWQRKLHVGFELGLPLIDLFLGWNEGYMSYGLKADLWLFNLTAGIYGQEIGYQYSEQELSRFIVQLELFAFDFEI